MTEIKIEAPKITENGREVISYTHLHDGDNGYLPHGIAICSLPDNDYHPYVVWTLYLQNGKWMAESGNYCETITEAVEHYNRRGGK